MPVPATILQTNTNHAKVIFVLQVMKSYLGDISADGDCPNPPFLGDLGLAAAEANPLFPFPFLRGDLGDLGDAARALLAAMTKSTPRLRKISRCRPLESVDEACERGILGILASGSNVRSECVRL